MLAYVCDWCKRPKHGGQRWILGFAAERMGVAGMQREIAIASAWSDKSADHPLAVHFCSEQHKQAYIAALFDQPAVVPTARTRVSARRHSSELRNSEISIESGVAAPSLGARGEGPRATRRRRPRFTAADRIRSRGLGVRLESPAPDLPGHP